MGIVIVVALAFGIVLALPLIICGLAKMFDKDW
jgi:hypothetical protein